MSDKKVVISWKKNLICTWIGQLLCMAGYSAIMPFIPLFIRDHYHITDDKQLGTVSISPSPRSFAKRTVCVSS